LTLIGKKEQFCKRKPMPEKEKHLCKWDKDRLEDKIDALIKIVKNPGFVCRKCGRAANEKKWLCKPVPLK
jgi:hypothetical protein